MTRAAWAPQTQERGLVYCEAGQCILVPTVCRNVSRITRAEVGNERAEADPFMPTPLSTDPPALAAADIDTAAPAEPFAIDALPSFGNTSAGAAIGGSGGSGGMGGFGALAIAGVAASGLAGPSPTNAGDASPRATAAAQTLTTEPPENLNAAAVPEPQTWALMIGGLALLVAARRRVEPDARERRRAV